VAKLNAAIARRGKLIWGGGCVLFVGALVVWRMTAMATPIVHIPAVLLPSPNAFDTYRAASAQVKDRAAIVNAAYTPELASRYRTPMLTLTDRVRIVDENRGAISTLRVGLHQQFASPPASSQYNPGNTYNNYTFLAKLLGFESDLQATRGQWDEAGSSAIDAIEMGGQIPRGSALTGRIYGSLYQAIGRKRLWSCIDHLSARATLQAARRMEKIRCSEYAYSDSLQEAKWAGQADLLLRFQANDLFIYHPQDADDNVKPLPGPVAHLLGSIYFSVHTKQQTMRDFSDYMDARIRRSHEPFTVSRPDVPAPHDLLIEWVMPFDQNETACTNQLCQNHLLELSLALRAFRLERGNYPEKLQLLVPRYIASIPTDPFGAGLPIKYRRNGRSYRLYSVGPDCKDDGGKMIDAGLSADQERSRHYVRPDSKGDILAGRNF